jgi:uncharacterized membrane protein SpoIIM required for sporulation/ABC-type transport system involved in multi-copper enzyme maturation permease subunit
MASLSRSRLYGFHDLRLSLLITRREVRDSFRDWRIIIPIVVLTLVFPALAILTARLVLRFTESYGAVLIGDRLVPFLLLVVGFFPMSFSLVIALETFVGEKERKSLEPLLATPLTNAQLYVGKMLAAIIPPMSTSYLGITVYVLGLVFVVGWAIPASVFAQILILSTVQGIIMVAAAVIVSSLTTSVRAANLLASFIIVPIALLLQFEAIILFWGNVAGLWWLISALLVTAAILIRMGIIIFNREELLGQDIDELKLGWIWRQIWDRFTGREKDGGYRGFFGWYAKALAVVPELHIPSAALIISLVAGLILGFALAATYHLPAGIQSEFSAADIVANTTTIQLSASDLPMTIFMQNLRVLILAAFLGIFTLGVSDILIFMLPWLVVGFLGGQLATAGVSPFLFIASAILPHAIFELPALLLAAAAAWRWHAAVLARPVERSVSENWLVSAADYGRVFVAIVIPLLIVGAFVEAYITPQIVLWAFGD